MSTFINDCHFIICTQLERHYQEKMEQLAKRERDLVQRSQRREEVTIFLILHYIHAKSVDTQELEASLYSQRQLVLQELELIRQREDHLIKQSDLNKLQFSDLHSTSERLKQEEQILKAYVLTCLKTSILIVHTSLCDGLLLMCFAIYCIQGS